LCCFSPRKFLLECLLHMRDLGLLTSNDTSRMWSLMMLIGQTLICVMQDLVHKNDILCLPSPLLTQQNSWWGLYHVFVPHVLTKIGKVVRRTVMSHSSVLLNYSPGISTFCKVNWKLFKNQVLGSMNLMRKKWVT
jgi:hypothetical protein